MPKVKNDQTLNNSDQVIAQFISNENKVLEKIYRHNYRIVKSYVLKNSGSEADAKDIFQEAMVITWLNLKDGKFVVKNEFSLSAYLYKIAKYKWLDKLKSKKNISALNSPVVDEDNIELTLDEYEESENRLNYLAALYKKLDNKCKEVLDQFYYQRKRLDEIASDMDYDLGSIRTIKYRCMQKLRKMHNESQTRFGEQ